MKPQHFLCSLLFLAAFGLCKNVSACSCFETAPVCEAFGDARAVFVGEVIEGTSAERLSEVLAADSRDRKFVFKVTEAFMGTANGKEIVIFTGHGGGDCGIPFQKGETYLVYAYGDEDHPSTSICTRTAPINKAGKEDFDFLRSLPKKKAGGQIFGQVIYRAKSSFRKNYKQPMAGLKIEVVKTDGENERKFYAVTDSWGRYRLRGLPTGTYEIKPMLAKHLEVDSYQTDEFLLNDKGCAKNNLHIETESEVMVRVLDPEGNPVKNIWVEFVPVDVTGWKGKVFSIAERSVTNPQGGLYEFNLPPDRYIISINYFDAPDAEAPFPTTFYPNVTDRTKAKVITVKPGTEINNLVLRIPRHLQEKTISGSVFWPDGTPAKETQINLTDRVAPRFCVNGCQESDNIGNFTLRGYIGRVYQVEAKAEKTDGKKTQTFRASTSYFMLDNATGNIRLTLKAN